MSNGSGLIQFLRKQPFAHPSGGEWWLVLCPFHDDRNPSCGVNAVRGFFMCHACHTRGSVVRLVQEIRRCEYAQAVEILGRDNSSLLVKQKAYDQVRLPDDYRHIFPSEEKSLNWKDASEYLQKRHISEVQVRRYCIGYCAVGKYAGRVVIPVYTNGELKTFIARAYRPAEKKVLYAENSLVAEALFGYDFYKELDKCVLVEGWADALAVERAVVGGGLEKGWGVLALGWNKISWQQLRRLRKFKEIVVLGDNDRGGRMLELAAKKLTALGCLTKVARLKKYKDAASASEKSADGLIRSAVMNAKLL